MNWSSLLNALPLGFMMFAVMVWRFYRRKGGHELAKAQYPALAERLGLRYLASQNPRQIGQLRGSLRGFDVVVDPDDQRKLIVRFRGEPGLDLRNYPLSRRPLRLDFFSAHERSVDSYFKTSYAEPEIAERLQAAPLTQLIEPFVGRYRPVVKELNLTAHGVTCVLDFGNPPHIPATVVEALLPALLELACVIEPALPEDPGFEGNPESCEVGKHA